MKIVVDKAYVTQLENKIAELESRESAAYVKELLTTIKSLERQVENLTEMLILMNKQKFGSSSEKTKYDPAIEGQLNFFNEAEVEYTEDAPEPIEKNPDGQFAIRKKKQRKDIIKDLPVKEILCEVMDEDRYCDHCDGNLKTLGKEFVRDELEYIPAKLRIIRYIRMSYECPKCKNTDTPFILKAEAPTPLLNHSLASPSSVANVMYQKYVNSMPLHRQEKDFKRMGLDLSRGTMANWVIRCSEEYLAPITNLLHKELCKREIVHSDESRLQVLKEEGKKPQSDSFMWLHCTGNDGKPPIVLYDYRRTRSGDNAVEFLKGFTGYHHCDGFSGYNKLENVTRCGCWSHLRRYFAEAIPKGKPKDPKMRTKAEIGRDYCNKLFNIEDDLAKLTHEERYKKRLELAGPVLDEFWNWLDTLTPYKGSLLDKAVTYARNQKPYMGNYLLDGRCSISNNTAENSIRPYAVGRKNWLFADTPKGAGASATVYSIVETANANGLDVLEYLTYLLMHMPSSDYLNNPEYLEELMPWSEECQALFRKESKIS
ncbi:MAG TPA: IS66 family transposase [Anaerovoracaceae bacterium]|jgi:transposase|nr:IS66 family transposase [Anaerovoracaceae bacterium]